MAVQWMDGFDHYGSDAAGVANMLDGAWAEASYTSSTTGAGPRVPAFGARTGTHALFIGAQGGGPLARRVLKASTDTVITSYGLYLPILPDDDSRYRVLQWRDGSNNILCTLTVSPTGNIILWSGNVSSVLAQTQTPPIVAGTWHHVEVKFVRHASAGTIEVRVDGTTVLSATALNTGAAAVAQIAFVMSGSVSVSRQFWIDDLVVKDATGTYNNGFSGDLRVAALFPNADTGVAGWVPRYRKKIGAGILDTTAANNSAVSAVDAAALELGSGDFTIETFVRFQSLPTGSNKAQIVGKWQESGNLRSYQLYKGGPTLNNGDLVFRISTNGQAGTVTELISWPWAPDLGQWYHVAIVRASGETMLYIDGIRQGGLIADANTYYDGAATLAIGGEMSSTTAVIANTSLDGWLDELRITKGVARYTSDFTPTTVPFGRNGTDDPDFSSVVLLAGFDNSVADESSYARALTARNNAAMHTPDDGNAAFETINQHAPRDDTFVEAALIAAEAILTFEANPSNGETVTIDDNADQIVYTFVTSLSSANDVLIGASATATRDNLIAAINQAAGEGTLYGTGTTAHTTVAADALPSDQVRAYAKTPGTAGNSIPVSETLTDGYWNGSTLAGGQDIPGESEFTFERPPVNTTIIRAISVVTRSYKSDSGAATEQVSFVGPQGAAANGADNSLTVDPTYREDVFETDPDTSAGITPSTLIGGRVRLDRTS